MYFVTLGQLIWLIDQIVKLKHIYVTWLMYKNHTHSRWSISYFISAYVLEQMQWVFFIINILRYLLWILSSNLAQRASHH